MVGKKGLFTLYVLIYTILGIGVSMFHFVDYQEHVSTGYIGDVQFNLLDKYSSAENDLFYLDYSLSNSDAFFNLLKQGGFSGGSINSEYTLWKIDDMNCYPTRTSLLEEFSILLNSETGINYSFQFDQKSDNLGIVGIPENNLIYNISKNEEIIGNYSVAPIVYFTINYNFDDFLMFVDEIVSIVDNCENDVSCWSELANFAWESENDVFRFSSEEYLINTLQGDRTIKINAAVDFNEINPLLGDVQCGNELSINQGNN
jgi:hypothetical protein